MNEMLRTESKTALPWHRRLGPAGWLVVVLALPSLVLYAALFLREQAILEGPAVLGSAVACLVRLAVSTAIVSVPLALFPVRARLYVFLVGPVLLILFVLNLVHVLEYEELVSIGAMDALLGTSPGEAAEFVHERGASILLALGLAAAMGVGGAWLCLHTVPRSLRLPVSTRILFAAAAVVACGIGGYARYRLFPVSTLKNAVEYVQWKGELRVARAERAALGFGAHRTLDEGAPEVHVLVLGETLRRANLPQYGYPRDTMPRLSRRSDVIVFDDVVSAANQTSTSVKAMLTQADAADVWRHAGPSILTLARESGFETYWLSNQDRTHSSELTLLAEEADHVTYVNHSWTAGRRYDEAILPHLDRALAGPGRTRLIVVHLMGSHGLYSQRYPEAFDRFEAEHLYADVPHLPSGLSRAELELRNHYDNSIRYTDHVLAEIIDRVASTGRLATVLFVADHGENLFDTPARLLGHGTPVPTRYELEIPMLLWYSPAYAARRPNRLDVIRRNAREPLTSAHLFDALADLLETSYRGRVPRHSFFGAAYEPGAREVRTTTGDVLAYPCLRPAPACGADDPKLAARTPHILSARADLAPPG